MIFHRLQKPAAPAVSVADVKNHLRLTHDHEDALIADLVEAAIEHLGNDTGLSLVNETWRGFFEAEEVGSIRLNRRPFVTLDDARTYDLQGLPQSLSADQISLTRAEFGVSAQINPSVGAERYSNGLEIDFVSGFGETAVDVPDVLRRAVIVLVAHWFEFRAHFSPSDQPVSIPDQYLRLVSAYKRKRL